MDCPKAKKGAGAGAGAVNCPPDDSLVEILLRLHAKPLFRFKCVSKAWCALIADRVRCRKFPETLEGFFTGDVPEKYGGFIDLSGRPAPLVDPSFSFLTKLPEINRLVLLDCCNGLVLFGHRTRGSGILNSLGYIVCNPATEQWVAVPRSDWTPWIEGGDEEDQGYVVIENIPVTRLIFDLAVSPHFQLVQLCSDGALGVRTFSSVTGAWMQLEHVPSLRWINTSVMCPFNGMLHVSTNNPFRNKGNMIFAVGVQGRPSRTIHLPANRDALVFVGQSQGRLHCLSGCTRNGSKMTDVFIWVLEDYNAGKWVLRDNVSFSHLFGRIKGRFHLDWNVIAIHPDRSLVFFVQYCNQKNRKIISYDMDTKEVHGLCTLGYGHEYVYPYVPNFAESAMLTRKL